MANNEEQKASRQVGLRGRNGDDAAVLLRRWLARDRVLFIRIVFLAVGLGLFSLAIPVIAQAVIGAVTASVMIPPVVVLGICLLLALLYVALLHILEIRAVEWLSRRIFIRVAHDLGERMLTFVPAPGAMAWSHRFFEVVSLEKGTTSILMSGLASVLTLVLGAVFLVFYDPWFGLVAVVFALFFMMAIGGSYRAGQRTALKESSAKYAIAQLLSDFESVPPSKDAAVRRERIDQYETSIEQWHGARERHFQVVLRQSRYLLALSAFGLASVIVIGGSFVALGQLTLGQLVAAELVVTGMAAALNKLTQVVPKLYDLHASFSKLAGVPGEDNGILHPGVWKDVEHATSNEGRHARRWALAVLFAPIVLALPWQQTVHGSGNVIAFDPTSREQAVDAPVKGRIKTWQVMEGTRVKAGDPLVELEDIDALYAERLEQNREAISSKVDAARRQKTAYDEKRAAYLDVQTQALVAARRKIEGAEQKKLAVEKKKEAVEAKKRAARLNLERTKTLAAQGIASDRDRELAIAKFAELESDSRSLDANILEADAVIAVQRAERMKVSADMAVKVATVEAEIQKAESNIASALDSLAKIQVTVARQAQQVVLAPVDGTVQWVRGHQGGVVVKEGERLLLIVPDVEHLAIEQYYDGNDVPLLRVGDPVRVQFEGWPALVLAGVPGAQPGTFAGRIAVIDPKTRQNGMVRVLVVPDREAVWPPTSRLRQGMRAQGWAVLNEVTIGYELWRRINGFPMLPDLMIEASSSNDVYGTFGNGNNDKGKK